MRPLLTLLCMLCLSVGLRAQAQGSVHVYQPTQQHPLPSATDLGDFTVQLPPGCTPFAPLVSEEEGRYALISPDQRLVFVYCYFPVHPGETQEERLMAEAAEMRLEVTGEGDIIPMKLRDDTYLSFSIGPEFAVGVTYCFPARQGGLLFLVVTPESTDEGQQALETLSSIRLKN